MTDDLTPATPLRVLCVDDHPDTAESLGTLLSLYGHEVALANDGEAALALAAGFAPQACVLDITCRGSTGTNWPAASGPSRAGRTSSSSP